jgi:hypothetical protein
MTTPRQMLAALAVSLCLFMANETLVGAEPRLPEQTRVEATQVRTVEGVVTKVAETEGTIQIAWGPFGLFAKTLQVEPDTRIRLVGRPATFEDLREGVTVRAGYQAAPGRSIAKSIDVVLPPIVSAERTSPR